jgi:hypothetical protein
MYMQQLPSGSMFSSATSRTRTEQESQYYFVVSCRRWKIVLTDGSRPSWDAQRSARGIVCVRQSWHRILADSGDLFQPRYSPCPARLGPAAVSQQTFCPSLGPSLTVLANLDYIAYSPTTNTLTAVIGHCHTVGVVRSILLTDTENQTRFDEFG